MHHLAVSIDKGHEISESRHVKLAPQKQMQEPFILEYKLDNCASDFHDVGGQGEKEQTGREREERQKVGELALTS